LATSAPLLFTFILLEYIIIIFFLFYFSIWIF